jgi:Tol biopolymer transport system component
VQRWLAAIFVVPVVAGAAGAAAPSERLISFWSDRAGLPGVWLMGVDGSDQRLLTGEIWAKRGSFSPDGSRLVFDGPVDVKANVVGDNFDLYVGEVDGSGIRRVTGGPARDVLATWSPDGTKIAFTRRPARNRVEEIWLVRPDGTALRRLRTGAAPVWSPDGRQIAFGLFAANRVSAWVMGASGRTARRVPGAVDSAPTDWSADGRRLLLTRWRTGDAGEIWSVNVDGSEPRRLTRNRADDFDAKWSPDATKILFTSDRAGSKDVWVMNADGTRAHRLTAASSEDWATDWQP